MRKTTANKAAACATAAGAASLAMVVRGEFEAVQAWWLAIGLLLPPLLLVLRTRNTALKVICLLAFTSQLFTLPFFYLDRDAFAFGDVKPFGFTAGEAWPMLSKVALFIVCLIGCFRLLCRIRVVNRTGDSHCTGLRVPEDHARLMADRIEKASSARRGPSRGIYTALLVLIVCVVTPLNLWMFSQGIGMVGIEPQRLPYKLSGILYYMTKYIVPLMLGILYCKTKRGFVLATVLFGYAVILGLTSVSRSSLVYVMLPVLGSAWHDRRRLLLVLAVVGTTVGYSVVSVTRNFVYIVANGKTGMLGDKSIADIITSIVTGPNNLLSADNLIRTFIGIFGRIDGFGNLVMSQYYDPNAVLGPSKMVSGMIWRGPSTFDVDLHHLQWLGHVLPEGFVNGGGLLSAVVIIGNASILWVLLLALVAACMLVFVERSAHYVTARYGLPDLVATVIICLLSMLLFIGGGGDVAFVYPCLFLLVASVLPPLHRFNVPS